MLNFNVRANEHLFRTAITSAADGVAATDGVEAVAPSEDMGGIIGSGGGGGSSGGDVPVGRCCGAALAWGEPLDTDVVTALAALGGGLDLVRKTGGSLLEGNTCYFPATCKPHSICTLVCLHPCCLSRHLRRPFGRHPHFYLFINRRQGGGRGHLLRRSALCPPAPDHRPGWCGLLLICANTK